MMINKIARFIAYHPKIILLISTLLLIPSVIGFIGTRVNYDIMSYLPEDLDSVKGEVILDEVFNNAANAFIVVEDMPAKDVVKVKEKIEKIEGVKAVTWTDSFLDTSIPQSILPDVVTDIFYSSDGTKTLIMVQFDNDGASEITMNAVEQIEKTMSEQCFMSGMSAIMYETKKLADKEAPIYIAVAVVLALIALSFTMTSWVLPFVLLAALGYAVIYNMGSNIFFGSISYITQSIAAILQLGVTMDYSVFLMDRFEEELLKTDSRKEAMSKAISRTFSALTGSSLTTVFGFLALCFMSFTLGRDIGFVLSKGVILGVLSVVIVLPAMILLFQNPILRFRHRPFVPDFRKLSDFSVNKRKILAALFLILIVPSYIAKENVDMYYDFSKALPADMPSVSSLTKLKNDFNMATTHFVIINEDIPAYEVSSMVNEFEKVDGISNVISLNTFVGAAISESLLPDSVKEICQKGGYRLMMVNSVYATATDEGNAQIDELLSVLHKYDPAGYLTGEGALCKDLVEVTARDFKITSIISIAAIFILIALVFKSFSIPIILVGCIELAIFINQSVSFLLSAEIPFVAPTIIGCVQLGATVDYAILMSTRFKEELQHTSDKYEAMCLAARASGRSIFQSAIVFFSATFGVYLICNISIVKSICSMLARGAVISAIVIMVFLPALLCLFEKVIKITSYKWRPEIPQASEKEEIKQ